jgi:LmbE family N-acetylglucosaminyl deacetylase
MSDRLTVMAVHAHPDDEATSTGGILARYAEEGVRTVVVTCTNGELGDLPGGIKPDADGHDSDEVVRIRRAELDEACRILGVSDLELLGYRDSGMADWEHKGHSDAFCNVPLDEAAGRIATLFEHYRPDVVVTYDVEAEYNHPDHIQASLATMAAIERNPIPRKAYYTASRTNRWAKIREMLTERGVELPPPPTPNPDAVARAEAQAARITTIVDVSRYAARKLEALRVHDSQVGGSFWSKLPDEALVEIFGEECFIRIHDATGAAAGTVEDDLLAGLR